MIEPINLGGTFTHSNTSLTLNRMGYGAMQLAGKGVFGLPRDVDAAVAVLREAAAINVVNLRMMGDKPSAGSLAEPLTVLAELKEQGLIRHLGLSNVTPKQLAEAQSITETPQAVKDLNAIAAQPLR